MNTSQRGHSLFMSLSRGSGRLGPRAGGLLFGMGFRRLAHPATVLVSLHASAQPLPVAGAVAVDDPVELVPVDLPKIVVAALLVPLQVRVRHGEAEIRSEEH